MNTWITERRAIAGLLVMLSLVVLFHLLVLLGVVPFDIVWGGRLNNRAQMVRMETVSVAVNLLMLAVVAVRAGSWKVGIPLRAVRIALWIMCALFFLNTAGNLLSENRLERIIFTPLTLLLALFCLRLALPKAPHPSVRAQ